jgi:hypothetical protein
MSAADSASSSSSSSSSSSNSCLAITIISSLASCLSQSQAPDVVECVIFTLSDLCCRMRAHVAEAVADVMAAVALSRGVSGSSGYVAMLLSAEAAQASPPSSTAPSQSYSSFRQSLDGEILKDMLVPHMQVLLRVFSRVLMAAADVCWGLVGNSNGSFVTQVRKSTEFQFRNLYIIQACNLLREVLTASASLSAAASLATASARAAPSIFGTVPLHSEDTGVADDNADDDVRHVADSNTGEDCDDDAFASHADAFLARVLSMPPGRKGRYVALQVPLDILEVYGSNTILYRCFLRYILTIQASYTLAKTLSQRKCSECQISQLLLLWGACCSCCLLVKFLVGNQKPRMNRSSSSSSIPTFLGGAALLFVPFFLLLTPAV